MLLCAPKLGKVITKLMGWCETTFNGSGDIELQDALHIHQYLSNTFPGAAGKAAFKTVIVEFQTRLEHMDPQWAPNRKALQSEVLPVPSEDDPTQDMFVAPWQSGWMTTDSLKDRGPTLSV